MNDGTSSKLYFEAVYSSSVPNTVSFLSTLYLCSDFLQWILGYIEMG